MNYRYACDVQINFTKLAHAHAHCGVFSTLFLIRILPCESLLSECFVFTWTLPVASSNHLTYVIFHSKAIQN